MLSRGGTALQDRALLGWDAAVRKQEGCRAVGASPEEDLRAGHHSCSERLRELGFGEEKALGRAHCGLPGLEGSL